MVHAGKRIKLLNPNNGTIKFLCSLMAGSILKVNTASFFKFPPRTENALSDTYNDFLTLPFLEAQDFRNWLLAGLDRGLLAEYRAWTATFQIYLQGKEEGLWSSRPWLEIILNEWDRKESLEKFTFHYLDQNSMDPQDGFFPLS